MGFVFYDLCAKMIYYLEQIRKILNFYLKQTMYLRKTGSGSGDNKQKMQKNGKKSANKN